MKNYLSLFPIVLALFIITSCTDEPVEQPQLQEENFEAKSKPGAFKAVKWGFCVYDIVPGRKIFFPPHGFQCLNLPGICYVKIVDCFYWIEFDPCLFPCGLEIIDPWDIYEFVDPRELISIPEKFDIKVNPETGMIPFPVNQNVIGLQYYNKIEEVLDEEVLILENDIELDERFAKENGLNSNIIPAGKYPVLFNEKNKTFNAFVSVGKNR